MQSATSVGRREFLQLLASASASGMLLKSDPVQAQIEADAFYNPPPFGNVHLLHLSDSHAQLLPVRYREPSVNLGFGKEFGRPPHLVGEYLLKHYGFTAGSMQAHAFSHLNFEAASNHYGRMGGFAQLSTLIQRLKATRKNAMLLDGGDAWQGSGPALWSNAQDMVDVSIALGVEAMTPHWEFTLGEQRVTEIVEKHFRGKLSFIAQNVKTRDFGDPVFEPYVLRPMNGVLVAVIGQAFPYTAVAHPAYLVPNWTFGIQEENLQRTVEEVRSKGAAVIVLLSHNGMDVDLKLASRVSGLHAVLGGHTHDAVPMPVQVKNPGGTTLVTNAGSHGKFLGVLDFEVKSGSVQGFQYKLLPVFSSLIPPDAAMRELILKHRAPFQSRLEEVLAHSETLLYRRGNFSGTFDQLILNGLMHMKDAEIAFSPGFRWGTSVLANEPITHEDLMNQTAITYPATTVSEFKGDELKGILEDVADNLFNPDPYYRQGGDMVRVGGLKYTIDPQAAIGHRISNLELNGKLLEPDKRYKVASWASVSQDPNVRGGQPIWELMSNYLRDIKVVGTPQVQRPHIIGAQDNPGYEPTSI